MLSVRGVGGCAWGGGGAGLGSRRTPVPCPIVLGCKLVGRTGSSKQVGVRRRGLGRLEAGDLGLCVLLSHLDVLDAREPVGICADMRPPSEPGEEAGRRGGQGCL